MKYDRKAQPGARLSSPKRPKSRRSAPVTAPANEFVYKPARTWFSGFSVSLGALTLSMVAASLLAFFSGFTAKSSNAATDSELFGVAELFTSHGCYSCPPADALFEKMIKEHPNVVALEYHVDYWDTLIHGSDGSFKDPFSSSDYTLRQQAYNNQYLEGRRGVYTPQMVLNGSYGAVGSQKEYIDYALNNLPQPAMQLAVKPSENSDNGGNTLSLNISARANEDELPLKSGLWLMVFHKERTTKITGGENNRKTLTNHHIVTSIQPIGRVGKTMAGKTEDGAILLAENVRVELEEGQGCAVLIQDALPGNVYAAGYCDRSIWK